jgi:hypothetical protein
VGACMFNKANVSRTSASQAGLNQASGLINAITVLLIVGGSAVLTACSTVSGVTTAVGPCLDDSKACVESRTAMVGKLTADPTRSWIGQSVDRRMAASGIRLFAYQNVADSLDCPKLQAGVREMQATRSTIGGTPLAGQTAERHNQIRALAVDMEGVLAAKARRKGCKAG